MICLHNFNPHSREGSDDETYIALQKVKEFQSTLPRREWHFAANVFALAFMRFQSTLPRREWHLQPNYLADIKIISIHTPAKGVTNYAATLSDVNTDFNPHSREGSDPVPPCWGTGL